MNAQASNLVNSVNNTFYFIVGVSVFFLVIITFCMIYFVIRYSRKRNPKATNIHGNIPLEIAWTVIPTLLALVMFWYGWTDYKTESTPPADTYNIFCAEYCGTKHSYMITKVIVLPVNDFYAYLNKRLADMKSSQVSDSIK